MKQEIFRKEGLQSVKYYIHGTNPKKGIVAGVHGGEHADIIERVIKRLLPRMPDFLFIPEVSPSAVSLGTRYNVDGIDVNRSFVEGTTVPETQAVMALLENYRLGTCITFHEHPGETAFYMYDTGRMTDEELARLRSEIQSLGVALYNGVDDPEDSDLRFPIVDGYTSLPYKQLKKEAGFLDRWVIERGVAPRVYNPEIPGVLPPHKKYEILKIIFRQLILPK